MRHQDEAVLHGETVSDDAIRADIAPCFVERNGERTDVVVLACTHYPLLLDHMNRVAPWPVTFIDPAPAIARRVVPLLGIKPIGHLPPIAQRIVVRICLLYTSHLDNAPVGLFLREKVLSVRGHPDKGGRVPR